MIRTAHSETNSNGTIEHGKGFDRAHAPAPVWDCHGAGRLAPGPLTESQARLLCAMVAIEQRFGRSGTERELAALLNCARGSIHKRIALLHARGWIVASGRASEWGRYKPSRAALLIVERRQAASGKRASGEG